MDLTGFHIVKIKEPHSKERIADIMDEFDIKILGASEEKLKTFPLHINVPDEVELMRNPYAE